MKHLVIAGGGFAGVWAALSAARERERLGSAASHLAITLVSCDPWLTIRPRLYEASLAGVRVPLDDVIGPAGVQRAEAEVLGIDTAAQVITIRSGGTGQSLPYDRLILAAGSRTSRPEVAGVDHAFGVDNFTEADALRQHLESLTSRGELDDATRSSAVIVGAGFTGIEVATTMLARLRDVNGRQPRVTLVERGSSVAPDMNARARGFIEEALTALGIVVRAGRTVTAIHGDGVTLDRGEWIPAATTVWTGGFRASGLTSMLNVECDESGRLPVDAFLRVRGVAAVYAAGDVARALADGAHVAPMSCQYAIPMGETAGLNAVADLSGVTPQPFAPKSYVTCVDLGEAGALFTEGWDRGVKLTGYWATVMKRTINRELIYPPVTAVGRRSTARSAA